MKIEITRCETRHCLRSALAAILPLSLTLAMTFAGLNARAAIVVRDYYRLGENDPGATDGGAITNAIDIAWTKNLAIIGTPRWTNDVSVAAAAHTGSFRSAYFSGSSYGTNSILNTVTDNFGIEAWVRPSTASGNHTIAYNGDTGLNGWGLVQNGSLFRGLMGASCTPGPRPSS